MTAPTKQPRYFRTLTAVSLILASPVCPSLMLARPEPGYMTKTEFEAIVDSVRTAIQQSVHPRMISQGSSGSYFARNLEGKVVGVFKPKDERKRVVDRSPTAQHARCARVARRPPREPRRRDHDGVRWHRARL